MKGRKMTNMKFLFVLPLLAIVLISGCTGPSSATAGNGVVILNFQPDFTQVNSDDSVKLQVRLQNQGEARARNVKTELTGINTAEWQTFGTGSFNENIGDLIPFDPATSTAGETKINTFSLKAPKLAKGIRHTFTPIIKVSYDYATTAQKPITIVDQDELRRITDAGQGTLAGGATTSTGGPLSVDITTGNFFKTSQGFNSQAFNIFPISIKITNLMVGNGVPIPDSIGTGGLFSNNFDFPIRVRVTPPTGTRFVSSGVSGFDDCSSGEVVKDMWQGKTVEITCELEVNSPPAYREDRLLMVEILYRYQSEASTQITVFGTQQPSGFFF